MKYLSMSTAMCTAVLFSIGCNFAAATEKKLTWAGCGISKNAFMSEMAAAYKKKDRHRN